MFKPPKGFIDPNDIITIPIPANLKQWILIHLRKFQDISTQTIYNDLHGFIRHSKLRTSDEAMLPLFFIDYIMEKIATESQTDEERQNQLQEVIKLCTERIQYSPYEVKTHMTQGGCYEDICEFDLAIETFSKVILLKPDYAGAYYKRGMVYFKKNKVNLAIKDFDKAIDLHPDYAETYYFRGLAYEIKGDYDFAIKNFTKAIDLKPNDSIAYGSRGVARLHLKEWEQSRADLTTAKNMETDIIALFRNLEASVESFEQKYGLKLPTDIVAMLTPPQA